MIEKQIALQTGRRVAASLSALSMICALPATALAGAFQVNPIQIMIPATKATSSLTIRNVHGQPVAVRVLTYRWTQADGDDVYTLTEDLIASPPIFTIPANGRQVVRVGLRPRASGAAYRVILEEIPQSSKENGVQVALRLNLPMYAPIVADGTPEVRWIASRDVGGELVIEGRNDGTAHAQITAIMMLDAAGRSTSLMKNMGVILPASMRRWHVGMHPELRPGSEIQLNIRSARGEERIMVKLAVR